MKSSTFENYKKYKINIFEIKKIQNTQQSPSYIHRCLAQLIIISIVRYQLHISLLLTESSSLKIESALHLAYVKNISYGL